MENNYLTYRKPKRYKSARQLLSLENKSSIRDLFKVVYIESKKEEKVFFENKILSVKDRK